MRRTQALVIVILLAGATAVAANTGSATVPDAGPLRSEAGLRSADGPALKVRREVTANRRGVMSISVTCIPTAVESCDGRLSLVERRETCACGAFGTATFSIPSGETADLRVKLNRKKTTQLLKQKLLRVRSIVVASDATNKVSTTMTPLAIRLRA